MTETLPVADAAAAKLAPEPAPAAGGSIGVLVVNLGTPDAADAPAVRRYLKEFLSDPRVIENQGAVWQLVLNGVILRIRPRRKARDYARIWNREKNESPLKTITRAQTEKLAAALASEASGQRGNSIVRAHSASEDERERADGTRSEPGSSARVALEPLGRPLVVDWAMRYGDPAIARQLEGMVARGCERILVVPLYPQYCAATTASVGDAVFRALARMRFQPALRIAPPYYADSAYIEALASSTRAALGELGFAPDVVLASFHGIPKAFVDNGDPYYAHCVETMRLLRAALGFDEQKLVLTFQSRFGRGKWLEPATITTVKQLAKRGVKNLVVITPGFSADCLETLEEIAVENAHVFARHGGKNFAALPCLNDSAAGMEVISQLVLRELKGWL